MTIAHDFDEAPAIETVPTKPLDPRAVRGDFPVLHQEVHGKPLVYLDSAATSQKPRMVIDAVSQYYERINSNVHRGIHSLSQQATFEYERARGKVKNFLRAASEKEIIFTRGATESINLVAQGWGRKFLRPGDEILISHMEHHSNIVPWQMLCEQTGAVLKVIPITDRGELDMEAFEKMLTSRVKLFSTLHVSNALGTINPVRELAKRAKDAGATVLIDGCQGAPHMAVDVQKIGCDFYAFSGHKVFAPTGIGVLWGKQEILDAMDPYQGGGDMIATVTFEKTTYNTLPAKFEAGTPHIAGAIGLGAAIDYLGLLGLPRIEAHEKALLQHGTRVLEAIPGLRLVGTAREKASVLSFVLDGIHATDAGAILDHQGIAVRVGHHCAQPVMARFGVPATIRASLAFYNTTEELDRLAEGLHKVIELFR